MKQCNNEAVQKLCIYDITFPFSVDQMMFIWSKIFTWKWCKQKIYGYLKKETHEKQSVSKHIYVKDETIILNNEWHLQ